MHLRTTGRVSTGCAFFLASAILMLTAEANGQELTPSDRYWVSLGVASSAIGIDARVDGQDQVDGSDVDFRRDLGLGAEATSLSYEAGFTWKEKHQLEVAGHRYSADGQKSLQRSLNIDDETYPAQAAFQGDLKVGLNSFSYTWLMARNERYSFGLGVTAVNYKVRSNLAAQGSDDGGEITIRVSGQVDESVWPPLVHVRFSHMLGSRFRIRLAVSGIKSSGETVSGSVVDASAALDYSISRHFGVTLKYRYNDVKLDLNRTSYRGVLDISNHGPQFLGSIRF